MSQPALELVYFGIPARAGPARFMVEATSYPSFTDTRIAFDQWGEMKATTPMGSLPLLKVKEGDKEVVLCQGDAINTYIAGLTGFPSGSSPWESAAMQEIMCACEDLAGKFGPTMAEKDEAKKIAMRKDIEAGVFPKLLNFLEERLARDTSAPWLVGPKMSVADLKLFFSIKLWRDGGIDHIDSKAAIAAKPLLVAWFKAMDEDPAFSAHLASAYPKK